jgi:hypothetical protein
MKRTRASSASEAPPEKRQRSVALQAANYQGHKDTPRPRDGAVCPEPISLCSRCSSIDIESLFVGLGVQEKAIKLMDLGKLGTEAELSSCSLCRLFHTSKVLDDDRQAVSDYALYLTYPPPPNTRWDGSVLAVVQETNKLKDDFKYRKPTWVEKIHRIGAFTGFIACSGASKTGYHAHSLRARTIDARSIDFDIIRGWMQQCDREHTKRCHRIESSGSRLKDLKLIDCERRRIVAALPSYEYSSLSYVWGTNRSDNDRCVHDELPTILPRTIEDALKVTQFLVLRYIWIDRYCIDQENDVEKQIQIQQMDLVYQRAVVTIVAAAGIDPNFGLPGVSDTPRIPQATAWVGGQCLVATLPDPRALVKAFKWAKRAWTYQESYFSTRRIIFTQQQVYYECGAGNAYEAVDNIQETQYFRVKDATTYDQHFPWSICSHLTEYCGRELSLDVDAIRAFEGVFHSFIELKPPVHQYSGIPIMPPIIMGLLGEIKEAKRSRSEAFAAGLSWCNTAPGSRRALFPTWSWAGWTAPISYQHELCVYGFKFDSAYPLKVFIENYDGSLLDMDKQSDVLLDHGIRGPSSKFVHIEAWTISIDIRYMPEMTDEWLDGLKPSPWYSHRRVWNRNVSGHFAFFQDEEGTSYVPLYSLFQTYEIGVTTHQSYAPDSEQDSLLGIVLGNVPQEYYYSKAVFVMIVHSKGPSYERVGHMTIEENTVVDTGLHSGSFWQRCFHSRKRKTIRLG